MHSDLGLDAMRSFTDQSEERLDTERHPRRLVRFAPTESRVKVFLSILIKINLSRCIDQLK